VIHFDELTDVERAYLDNPSGRSWVRARVTDAGLELEERSEGLLVVDPSGIATDIQFPGPHGNAHQLALLLVDQMLDAQPGGARTPTTLSDRDVRRAVDDVFGRFPSWAKSHREPEQRRALTGDAIALLEAFGLARRDADGSLTARPVLARYRVGEPTTTTTTTAPPGDPTLFDDALCDAAP
jgi:uncharacterized protein (TIGR02678 family)